MRLLVAALQANGGDVVATREPGGSPGAEEIRRLLVEGEPGRWDAATEALLHTAARRDHLRATVWPALEAGRWVVSDRFHDSSVAYQGYGHGLGADRVEALQTWALGDFAPHLTLILDLPVEAGLARAAARGGAENRYERMDLDFHRRLRQGFLDIAARHPGRCVVIDAGQRPEEVHATVLQAVRAKWADAV